MLEDEPSTSFIRYHEYTPTTIDYDHELDAYTVARADIYAFDRRHHLTLSVVVTEAQMIVHRPGLEQAIRQGHAVLERLVLQHQAAAAQLAANTFRVYTLGGVRLR
ncbi:MAG TPA: hypothetical protein VFW70_15745 [Methylomirabilota bacterium]|nr:hypothetical protein [Methylomirabilota bacterium]